MRKFSQYMGYAEILLKHPRYTLTRVAALLALGALSACSGQSAIEPTATAQTTRGPRLTPTLTETAPVEDGTPEVQSDTTATEQTSQDDACLTCHADAETLQVLAVEEEPAESLSSGEG